MLDTSKQPTSYSPVHDRLSVIEHITKEPKLNRPAGMKVWIIVHRLSGKTYKEAFRTEEEALDMVPKLIETFRQDDLSYKFLKIADNAVLGRR